MIPIRPFFLQIRALFSNFRKMAGETLTTLAFTFTLQGALNKIIFLFQFLCFGWLGEYFIFSLKPLFLSVVLCACVFFHREGFFRLQDVWDILEGHRSTISCCEYSVGCSYQVLSSPYLKMSVIFHLQRQKLQRTRTGEKTIWYIGNLRKDDIYWYRI